MTQRKEHDSKQSSIMINAQEHLEDQAGHDYTRQRRAVKGIRVKDLATDVGFRFYLYNEEDWIFDTMSIKKVSGSELDVRLQVNHLRRVWTGAIEIDVYMLAFDQLVRKVTPLFFDYFESGTTSDAEAVSLTLDLSLPLDTEASNLTVGTLLERLDNLNRALGAPLRKIEQSVRHQLAGILL